MDCYMARSLAVKFACYYADRMMISNGVRQRSVMEGMPMESITIDAWLDHIQEKKAN